MRRSRKPTQGTNGFIKNLAKQEAMIAWAGDRIWDETLISTYLEHTIKDPDHLALLELKIEGRMTDERAAPYLTNLYEKYERWAVGTVYRYLKYLPRQVLADRQTTQCGESEIQ